jgi:hypothetical protein
MQVTAYADGKPLSGSQRKSVAYLGNQVRCLIGWTGLAVSEGYNTGDWLHRQADALSQDDPPLKTFIENLADSATLRFATLREKDKRCEFSVGRGF